MKNCKKSQKNDRQNGFCRLHTMDRLDLIFGIVCDVAEPSTIFTKEEVGTLMLVCKSCADCTLAKHVAVVHKATYLLDQLHSNTISLAFAKRKSETEKYDSLETKEEDIIKEVFQDKKLLEHFTMGLMAEYKELIYDGKHDMYFSYQDRDVLDEYELIVETYFGGENAVYEHEHDPEHSMFQVKSTGSYYSFYYEYEIYGYCILDYDDIPDPTLDGFSSEEEEEDY